MRFLQDITFGQYISGSSLLHRLDTRAKLLYVLILLPAVFSAKGLFSFLSLTLLAITAITISGLRFGFIAKSLRHFFWLFLFAAIFHSFFTPGERLPYLPLASYEGVNEGVRVIIQLILAIIFSNLLIVTTAPLELTLGLERLLSPLKKIGVPVSDISMMMLVAIRFIPILKLETESIVKAQAGRGVSFGGGGFVDRARNIPVVLIPLIYNSFRRADELANAMISRGYLPGKDRGSLRESSLGLREYLSLGVIMISASLCFVKA